MSSDPSTTATDSIAELAALIQSLHTMAHNAIAQDLPVMAKNAIDAQANVSNILLARLISVAGADAPAPPLNASPLFEAGTPPTPEAVALATPVEPEAQYYWVVLRGREPGLYLTGRAATEQTNGVPGQYQERKTGRTEALAFYAANYPDGVKRHQQSLMPPSAQSEAARKRADVARRAARLRSFLDPLNATVDPFDTEFDRALLRLVAANHPIKIEDEKHMAALRNVVGFLRVVAFWKKLTYGTEYPPTF
ncbi:hypothetical protein B0H17DRAFT_1202503 [Mycena rosella]|uniref:Uncharacterized protein n=1 Tax=Mycena rosella TaxID=1033263 RepID=A0AAD7DFN7_MYCRO|nr:hypothetical protein B0H17DRAFT_1202503 [Mycena rosella]